MLNRDQITEILLSIQFAVDDINSAKTVVELISAVHKLRKLHLHRAHVFNQPEPAPSNATLDAKIMSEHLESVCAHLQAAGTTAESTLIAALGIDKQQASLVIYYLRAFGCVERTGRGKTAQLRWLTDKLKPWVVADSWTSIQGKISLQCQWRLR